MIWFEMQSWASLANSWQQKASRRRRQLTRAARLLGTVSERLEDRQFLSAVAMLASPPDAREVAPLAEIAEPQQGKKFRLNLTGVWTIRTDAGPIELNTVQRGKRIRGTADLGQMDVGSLLNLPIPLPIPINVPPIEFKGKFKHGVLNVNFKTEVGVPIPGTPTLEITGNIIAHLELGTGLVGHLIVNVNGTQVLSTDFTSPLPTPGA